MKKTRIFTPIATISGVACLVFLTTTHPYTSATTCGYYTEHVDREDNWASITIPIIDQEVPFPGGRVETAFWGNCSSKNEKIRVDSKEGSKEICVSPGEAKLGKVNEQENISGASKIGDC